jgi:hypothetical protein
MYIYCSCLALSHAAEQEAAACGGGQEEAAGVSAALEEAAGLWAELLSVLSPLQRAAWRVCLRGGGSHASE